MNVLVVDVAHQRQDPRHRTERTRSFLGANVDSQANGGRSQEARRGLEVRRGLHRIPGRVVGDRAITEPRNLAHGWVGFDFAAAFGRPVKVINDAAMQALGATTAERCFSSARDGPRSTLMVRGHIVRWSSGPLLREGTIEDCLGARGSGSSEEEVAEVLELLVPGSHRASPRRRRHRRRKRQEAEGIAAGCRLGDNAFAFLGGFRMWERDTSRNPPLPDASSRPGKENETAANRQS